MNYKDGNVNEFLDFKEDVLKECLNSDYVHFDFEKSEIREHFNEICDFVKDVYFPAKIFNLSVDVPVFFIIQKNNKNYYYKGTPERIRYIIDCLSRRNFTEFRNLDKEIFNYEVSEELDISPATAFSIQIFPPSDTCKNDRGGDFFNYLIKTTVPSRIVQYLKRHQIFTSIVDSKNKCIPELNDCCFVYALKTTGLFNEKILNKIRLRINNRYLSNKSINEVCKEFKIHLILNYLSDEANKSMQVRKIEYEKQKFVGVSSEQANYSIEMNLYKKHYFIEEITPFSYYYIKHFEKENKCNFDKELNHGKYYKSRYLCKSSELIRKLMKKDCFIPITYGHFMVLNTEFYKFQDSSNTDYDLQYNPKFCTELIEDKKGKEMEERRVYFADFESDVSGDYHRPYLCAAQSEDGKEIETFKGGNCAEALLDFLPNNSITYFHNLAYDVRMFARYGVRETILKGTKCLKALIIWKKKKLSFKDSLALFNCKLAQLPSMFGLEDIKKELFPYNYYTYTQLAEGETEDEGIATGIIEEAGKYEIVPWSEKEYKEFEENINQIGARIDEKRFDMYKYAEFYCQQDVRILRESFNVFRKGFLEDFKIDVIHFISISSLANEVFNQNVYYPNKHLYKVGGHLRHFLSKAVYGGRCMCAYNKKWHVHENLCDYDAVSLYPSAMARLWTVEGKPKVIEDYQLNMDFLSQQSAYIVEIKITAVHKHYPFPLILQKIDGLNVNDDKIIEPKTMIVDNIYLEDLINFQKIEFELIKGYYWDGKRDYRIREEIKKIFDKRVEYKKQKNPLQQLYKLIMNSCYGKTIEKPVEKDIVYIQGGEKVDKFVAKNYNKIIEIIDIRNSDIYGIKEIVPIDHHFNFSLLGVQVLSMSKRIMNEVMCLAYDIGCRIYYQDTDSMHIVKEDLDKLEKAFEQKYNRPLKGTNLGQFHTDFSSFTGREDVEHAIESIFLMKKMYIDKLLMKDGTVEFMFRGKGLTTKSILALARESFNNDLMTLYEDLFKGNTLTFDLTQGQPCFRMAKDLSVVNIEEFKRKIKTEYEEGKEDEYFK